MTKTIKRLLSEYSDFDADTITTDMSIHDDLFLNKGDLQEIVLEIQDYFGCDIEDPIESIIYVCDLMAVVKSAI